MGEGNSRAAGWVGDRRGPHRHVAETGHVGIVLRVRCCGQQSGRVDVACDHVRHRLAAVFPTISRSDNRHASGFDVGDVDWPGIHDEDHLLGMP